jgi:hypothetical protein
MILCRISRNDAELRVANVLAGKIDPGPSLSADQSTIKKAEALEETDEDRRDLVQEAHDQIVAHIQYRWPPEAVSG